MRIKKQTPINFVIEIPLYHYDFMVSIGETPEQFKKSTKEYQLSDENIKQCEVKEGYSGRSVTYEHLSVIRITEFNFSSGAYSTLHHELFHCVAAMLRFAGFKLKRSSEEAYAYLISYLTYHIYQKLHV